MSAGGYKRKIRGSVTRDSAEEHVAPDAGSSAENSDLESGEIAQHSEMDLEESAEEEKEEEEDDEEEEETFGVNGAEKRVKTTERMNSEPSDEDISVGDNSPKRRREIKKQRSGKTERGRVGDEREEYQRHRHRRYLPSQRRLSPERIGALSYRERERLRKKEESNFKRRHRASEYRIESNRHRHHSKRHKRRHREKDRNDEPAIEIDVDEPMEDVQFDEATIIERQREERRKRMEAIKNKHKEMAKKQTGEEMEIAGGHESDGGSGKSTGDIEPPVEPASGGSTSPDSVSSADLTLFNHKSEDGKVVDQVASVFHTNNSSQLRATAEVEVDKKIQIVEKDECSADLLKMLKDEKHDKEKLLADTQNTDQPEVTVVHETDDIFCDTPEGESKDYTALDNAVKKAAANRGLTDAYDDAEGYYKFRIGEILDNRYEISSCKGKGVFSTVLRGKDKVRKDQNGEYPEVCVKVIRANDLMKNCGRKEEQFLKRLASTDLENKRHCVRLLRSFVYRGHLCLVFEPMAMNLRELTKKFGRDVGLSLDGVGHFSAQLLVALKHLKTNKILHADIKPDNILVNEKLSRLKLCDFGSAMEDWSTEITPYVCSRFYRPPEVILGLEYSYGMDMWSLGCVIYEMFTGQYLFPGRTNNGMLKLMMDVKGAFPRKLLKKAAFCGEHFEKDNNMSFVEIETDKISKKPVHKLISNPAVKNNFQTLLSKFAGGCDHRLVAQLADLLEKMMMLDPDKRIDVDEAMRHPFIKTYLHKAKNAQHQREQQEQAAQQKSALK